MAMFFPYVLQCRCGQSLTANLADGVNADRAPDLRREIIDGTFHRVVCTACGQTATVEKGFVYTDPTRGSLFQVLPRHDRHLSRDESDKLRRTVASFPSILPTAEHAKIRVIFGMAELREKLVAQDLDLDDRAVELLKVAIVNDHPFLLHRPRLRLSLSGASHDEIKFAAAFDHDTDAFEIGLPKQRAGDLLDDSNTLHDWVNASHASSILDESGDLWVNMWRWSPQPSALEKLRNVAAQLRAGQTIDTSAVAFRSMLAGLPRGTHLPGWAKTDLQLLFDHARSKHDDALQEILFEIRFAKNLTGDWSTNTDKDDIDSIWKLLKALPASHFETNASINNVKLGTGGGGLYYPTSGDIFIGERSQPNREGFEDVFRHEVAHGVQASRDSLIDAWLTARFGWHMFAATQDGVDQWVELMGGWQTFSITPANRRDIPALLTKALGEQSGWNPGPAPQVPTTHGWHAPNFGPRLAYAKSGANWYQNFSTWHQTNGYAFFLNFWYKTLCAVSLDTLDLIRQMPSSYAAMSPEEFFAELYALYYDPDDPARPAIPSDVSDWMAENLSDFAFAVPVMPTPREAEPWDDIVRPKET